MKICKKCEIEKELSDYYLKSNGKPKTPYCKDCYNIVYKTKYDREYYENNKEMFKENYKNWTEVNDRKEYLKKYNENNKEYQSRKKKEYRENNKESIKLQRKIAYEGITPEERKNKNKKDRENYHKKIEQYRETKNKYFNERVKNDPLFKLSKNIRSLISNAFKRQFTIKSKKTIEILGCSFEEFYRHLESQFDDKMNWENQGSYWHMDHIKPISLAENEKEVYELNHYTNFQPLYWEDNLKKSDKYS